MTRSVHIRVPASSANIGPGYDSFGLALAKYDEVTAELCESGLDVTVEGVGAGVVPTDATHLVVQAAQRAWEWAGLPTPGLRLHCVNRIPHGGGQGSSAAAIVAGILIARTLAPEDTAPLSGDDVFTIATAMEGHPDNVAPVLFGGFTIAWMTDGGVTPTPRAVRLDLDPRISVMVFTADESCSTAQARAALPETISHRAAAANSSRAALLAHAITADPGLLLDATEDYLHQRYREGVMPQSAALLHRLRASGLAAVLSGAGPSVLVLGSDLPAPEQIDAPGFHAEIIEVPAVGALVDGVAFGAPHSGDERVLHR